MTVVLNRWELEWWGFLGTFLLADKLDNIETAGCRDHSRRPQVTEVKSKGELEPVQLLKRLIPHLVGSLSKRLTLDLIFLVCECRNCSDVCPLLIVSQGPRVDKRDHGGVWRLPVFPARQWLHSEDRTRLAVQLPHPERSQRYKVGPHLTLHLCTDAK